MMPDNGRDVARFQRIEAEWKRTLAARGWEGYIIAITSTIYRAGKLVDDVGVELAGDTPEQVMAMIDRVEVRGNAR